MLFQRAVILGTCTLVTILYAMTVTIANVSLPQMQGALSATQDQITWVVTFNIVATAVATPLTGWLVGRFGRRRLLIYAIIGFAIASLACGLADSLGALIFFRVLQAFAEHPWRRCARPLSSLPSQGICTRRQWPSLVWGSSLDRLLVLSQAVI